MRVGAEQQAGGPASLANLVDDKGRLLRVQSGKLMSLTAYWW